MTEVRQSGSLLVSDWHRRKDSKEYFSTILQKKKRKIFGLLESPLMPPHGFVDTVHYKIFLSGKSGVGKSALAARLAGVKIPSMHYETTGVETTQVYWPVKLRESSRVLFFRFQLWDCGENALRRFDHLLPVRSASMPKNIFSKHLLSSQSCKEQLDAVLLLFSFTDRMSFDQLTSQIPKWAQTSEGRVVTLVVGTKFDLFMHCDVTEKDVRDFQDTWKLPLLRTGGEAKDGLDDVAPILDCLAENLWRQDCVMSAPATAGGPLSPT